MSTALHDPADNDEEEMRRQIADGLRRPLPDREMIAKKLWESQRARIKNPDGINARLSWRERSVPDAFWRGFELDAETVIAVLGEGPHDRE